MFEGERTLVKDNHRLGKFEIGGIIAAPRGVPQIEVTFQIDVNSILSVTAKDKASGKSESITITNDKGRLSKDEIDAMIKDSEKYAEQDKILKEKLDAKSSLDNYLYTMRSTIEDRDKLADKLDSSDKSTISNALDSAQDWAKNNEDDGTKEDFEE